MQQAWWLPLAHRSHDRIESRFEFPDFEIHGVDADCFHFDQHFTRLEDGFFDFLQDEVLNAACLVQHICFHEIQAFVIYELITN